MKKLIYMVNIDDSSSSIKHSDYSGYAVETWKYWCNKHNVELIINTDKDNRLGKPVWHKELIFEYGKDFDKIGIVDDDTMIKWDAPDIFESVNTFAGVVDTSDYNWILNSINVYKKFFPDLNINVDNYLNAGVLFFDKKYLNLFEEILNFYFKNKTELDNWNKGGGKEQTILNYHIVKNNIPVQILNPGWNLVSMHKKDMFKHNWQLNIDQIPHFIKYGYIWHFTGFDPKHREDLMKQTWLSTKHLYK